jgi:hypothetical protein
MGLVGGIPSDINILDNTFVDVNTRPHGAAIDAFAHNAQGQPGMPPIERLIITRNTFVRSGGSALSLIGITESRIEHNRIESPVRATLLARPQDAGKRQAIQLRTARSIQLSGNTLIDPVQATTADSNSRSPMLGLDDARQITLDGESLSPVPPANAKPRTSTPPVGK